MPRVGPSPPGVGWGVAFFARACLNRPSFNTLDCYNLHSTKSSNSKGFKRKAQFDNRGLPFTIGLMSTNTIHTMQTTSEHGTATDFETITEALTGMPTCELIEHAWNTPELSPLTVVLLDRLESYAAEIDRMEDAMRAAGLLVRKQVGKVVDLRTRRLLN